MKRDYRGIDKSGLNQMATLQAYSSDELKIVTNMFWRAVYGHDVIIDTWREK